jgi:hypothetical protein
MMEKRTVRPHTIRTSREYLLDLFNRRYGGFEGFCDKNHYDSPKRGD